ncbi:RSP1, partial [Symbiodinium sp. KB8]
YYSSLRVKLVDLDMSPYVDFALFVGFQHRFAMSLKFKSHILQPDGSFRDRFRELVIRYPQVWTTTMGWFQPGRAWERVFRVAARDTEYQVHGLGQGKASEESKGQGGKLAFLELFAGEAGAPRKETEEGKTPLRISDKVVGRNVFPKPEPKEVELLTVDISEAFLNLRKYESAVLYGSARLGRYWESYEAAGQSHTSGGAVEARIVQEIAVTGGVQRLESVSARVRAAPESAWGLCALPEDERGDGVADAVADLEHILQEASNRTRSKRSKQLVENGDLSQLREKALQAFRDQERLSLNEALEQGAVPCRRRGCRRRHDNSVSSILGLGFCSPQCAEKDNERQHKALEKCVDEEGFNAAGLHELDMGWLTQYGVGMVGGMSRLRFLVFNEDIAFRLSFEHCARHVEEAAGLSLDGVRSYFRTEQERRNAAATQAMASLQLNYQAAHKVFPAAWSLLQAAVEDVGLESDAVLFSFANAGRVMRATACAACDRQSIKDYSKTSSFLSFSILVPENDAWKMCEVYDRLAARGVITVRLWNKLTPKAYYGEYAMHVLLNCKLQATGHIFEVRLCFGAFYHLEQDLSWLCDWRELLRSQHHFLPGEENHYQGQVRDKVGQLIDVEVLTPKSALPGKPDGEGVMCYADGGDLYRGQWVQGKKHGQGAQYYCSGDSYQGEYQNHKKHGQGIYRYADGDCHEGQYLEGRKHGSGLYWYSDGRVLVSNYDHDQQSGPGVVWSTDGLQAWLTESGIEVSDLDLDTADEKAREMGFPSFPRD